VRRAGDLAGPLSIGADEPVFAAKRLFSATSAPVIYSINVIPVALIEPGTRALLESGYSYTESTYEFLQRKCNQKVHHQRSAVRAVPADEQLARTLNCQAGDALLCLEEVGYSSDLTPLFYALNHFPGSAVSLLLERAPAFNITGPSAARSLRATSGEEI
jgi:DNA-binding GntR family transcriptional regulator